MPESTGAFRPPLSPQELDRLLRVPPWWKRAALLRSIAISLLSSAAVLLGMAWLLAQTEGWESVRRAFFSWPDFRAAFPKVWDGFKLNVRIFLIAEPLILIFGQALAVMRITRSPALFPLRALATAYIDLFRGIPALLVIMMLGFGMPALRIEGLPQSPVVWGTIACIVTSSAYAAETFRAGLESVHPSQRAAARSLGLSELQTFLFVVQPQAVRRVIPPLLSGFVSLQKETALVSSIGPLEATRQAQVYSSLKFNYSSYVAAAVLFIAITIPLARFTDYLLRRAARRREAGGPA